MDYLKETIIVVLILLGGYLLANVINGLIAINYLLPQFVLPSTKTIPSASQYHPLPSNNFSRIINQILVRNIFDSQKKKFPDKATQLPKKKPPEQQKKPPADAPCSKSNVKIQLVGTIITTKKEKSVAFIVESGYKEPDMYFEGEYLFDEGNILITEIKRNMLILDNNGKKECVFADEATKKIETTMKKDKKPPKALPKGPDPNVDIVDDQIFLDPSYVEKELGPGFANILNKQRLVPNIDSKTGATNGFKIFSIQPDSLFAKLGIQNGDIITGANDFDLRDPTQGFKLFETLKEESEVTITFIRKGKKQQRYIKIK